MRVLITAGPTWVAIDKVRVISNSASGQTGIILAKRLARSGLKVTLVAHISVNACPEKNIKIIKFSFFDQLLNIVKKEVSSKKYDIFIHSAAVSDYRPRKIFNQKIKSGIKKFSVDFIPTPKIIDLVKQLDPEIFLVGFKYEPDVAIGKLTASAKKLLIRSRADLVVANTQHKNKYNAFILSAKKIYPTSRSKNEMVTALIKAIGANYGDK